jgi:TolA-binding protein
MQSAKIFCVAILLLTVLTGCGNLSPRDNASPRIEQQLDNVNGKIDRIESNQNAIKFSLEKRNENSGVQFLQGEGGLLLGFGVVSIICATLYFYYKSQKTEKINQILANQIKEFNDPDLEESVLRAAIYTNVEKDIFHMISQRTQ